MTPLEEFLVINNLKQKDLADYLGLSKGTISAAVKGLSELSERKKAQLMMHPDWDTKMLPYGRIVQAIGNTTIGNHSVNTQILGENEALKRENELLKQLLEEKERTIQILMNK